MRKKIIIMGAAGRDFHNFNVHFKDNSHYEVVAFTAAQIPGIHCRIYPPELAGPRYPAGIPVYPEEMLPQLIREFDVDEVVFAYSDVSHEYIMCKASLVLACGADFCLMGAKSTMLKAEVPVISVCAVRTGSGKSQTSRQIARFLKSRGLKVVVIRHPMPYGDLKRQILQRFASHQDLANCKCTIEELEEYEPHVENGIVVYAGVDYGRILKEAQNEADIIIWDGGNNDLPFLKPDLHIVLADPHRVGHELIYYPSAVNIRLANVVIVNKVDTADPAKVKQVKENVKSLNPGVMILEAASPITVDKPELIRGRRVLVIEDGPTVTHGDMPYGAATIAAEKFGAKELVNPKPFAVGSIKDTYAQYPHLGAVLPAVGYSETQIAELEETINATACDVVLIGTPIDLGRLIKVNKPTVRVKYELQIISPVCLEEILEDFLKDVVKH
ncbi:MAG: cyclic 2,3-diphosphoglycerate synthase [Candidatus Bathyarchaeia archaeon]